MSKYPEYNPKTIEKKWQDHWDETGCLNAEASHEKPKFYPLIEFPYPSGAGLHVGHPRSNTAMDIIARKRRMEGYNVLFPIGYDAFGLPTENFAIKNKIHPAIVTKTNVDHFREQLKRLGFSFDYTREINTTDPKYYKWTQWIFLKLFEHGLAYKNEMPINWCTSCKVGLANEEVVGGVCERCGGEVVRKVKSQWMLRITAYAQKLLDGLDEVNFIEKVATQQRNWIGRSEGAEVDFTLTTGDKLRVFTTRPDTLFGATYMVISPEHPLVEKYKDRIANYDEIAAYREAAARKSDFERTELNKDKTGVEIKGLRAINPVTGTEIPVWISDYVLMGYGTGAIMAVPAHDERDWAFAARFGLPIIEVVAGGNVQEAAYTDIQSGTMVNSGFLNGLSVKEAKKTIIEYLQEKGLGERKVNFKLRDWVFSRQRYWGEPIPLVKCDCCGWVPLPYDQLPLKLPDVENYEPTDDGESPLAAMTDWVNTTCPHCGGPAKRETDTMPQWAGSSWYFLRYMDPHNDEALASKEALDYWAPVDWYNGGMEHTTLHLLYSRFWYKFLYDIGVVPTKEPYAKRTSQGMILGEGGVKMSKSLGNVINPTDVIEAYGADTMRTYIMFIGDFEKAASWSANAVKGCKRFLDRVWTLGENVQDDAQAYSPANASAVHKTIKKVTSDIDNLKPNTAIAALMTLLNQFGDKGCNRAELRTFLQLLSPFAPHICDEIWENHSFEGICSVSPWPSYDEAMCRDAEIDMAVQVNGKLRGAIHVEADSPDDAVIAAAQADEKVARFLEKQGGRIVKTIVVKNKLVNLIVK